MFFNLEILRRGEERGVGASGGESNGARGGVGADRDPLNVTCGEFEFRQERQRVIVRRVPDLADSQPLALQILDASNAFRSH